MTIKELIIQLLEFPSDTKINLSNDYEGTLHEIKKVSGIYNHSVRGSFVTIDFDTVDQDNR